MKTLLPQLALTAAILIPFTYQALQPLPEVWLGDRTNACIIIVQPDGTTLPCPADMSDLPARYNPIYVFEE